MEIEINNLAERLLDSLEQFDSDTLPLGLYASDELVENQPPRPRYQEWDKALLPCLKLQIPQASLGYYTLRFSRVNLSTSQTTCHIPHIGNTEIVLIKFSNIKVRKYGSRYRVDNHKNRMQRWKEIDLSGRISGLWKQPDLPQKAARILLFIGFDKSARPLERELGRLHETLNWEKKAVVYSTRTWRDKAERGFSVRLSAWSRRIEEQFPT
jgi:hypothetical protein